MQQVTGEKAVPIAATGSTPSKDADPGARRLVSLDAFRGAIMLLLVSEGLGIVQVAKHFPDSPLWQFFAHQLEHVEWLGCTTWDLIQPSFTFMVGVALPFSLANRRARGQTFSRLLGHAVWRSFVLCALGIFLRSAGRRQLNFTFEDVVTQIGLGYTFLFLIAWLKPRKQFVIAIMILVGYWAAFALYPAPGPDFDFQKVGVPADWNHHFAGFAAHWDKNSNLGAAVDQWFLNLFPREQPFVFNSGGYLTLSFIPSLVTMIFGLLAGEFLRRELEPRRKFWTLMGVGVGALALGTLLDATGICPSVKKIWTPSWTIFSGGWACILLAVFYGLTDWKGWKVWAYPLVVVGVNSIAMYIMAHWFPGFIRSSLKTVFGQKLFDMFGANYVPMMSAVLTLLVLWLICWWMYRRKVFIKI